MIGVLLAGKHQHIVIVDLFLAVGKAQECLVSLVEILLVKLNPEHVQTVLECRTSAARRQNDRILVYAHLFRVYYLVALAVLEHTVLMYAARMSKRISTHYSLIRLHRHIHEARHHSARATQTRGVDIAVDAELLV